MELSAIDRWLPLANPAIQGMYRAMQEGKRAFSLAHKSVVNQLNDLFVPERKTTVKRLSPETLLALKERQDRLFEADWQDAEAGIYPVSLLFDSSLPDFLRYYPSVWLDMPGIWERTRKREYHKFSDRIDREGYPDYYLQNFHYQTDGYLSDRSADLYDLQVEILFSGTADGMRRRILKPLKENLNFFAATQPRSIRVLDVACGTGRTLKMLRATLPKASLFGIDLSPAYLRKANQILTENPGELPQLIQANAETLPFADNYFHGLTNVFVFHELPPQVRQNVIAESFRVLQPGGVLIICDSIQMLDSPEFQTMMENFPAIFHEPYFKNYVNDDLTERLEKVGFEKIAIEKHLVSKYWIARKPL